MQPISYNLSSFGSRLSLIFEPSTESVYHGSLGRGFDAPVDMLLAVRRDVDGSSAFRYLPVIKKNAVGVFDAEPFELCDMQTTMTSITLTGRSTAAGVELKVTFISPFCPGDTALSTAPFFYIDIEVSPLQALGSISGKALFKLRRKDTITSSLGDSIALDYATPVRYGAKPSPESSASATQRHRCRDIIQPLRGEVIFDPDLMLFGMPFGFSGESESASCSLMWSSHCGSPVLLTGAGMRRFKHTQFFDSAEAVADYARRNQEAIRRKTSLFDAVFPDSILHQRFQAYSMNAIWCEPLGEEQDWFSVWEGENFYNSTLDPDYRDIWPPLAPFAEQQEEFGNLMQGEW